MKSLYKILFSLFILGGLPISYALNKNEYINDNLHFGIVSVWAICLFCQQVYFGLSKPISQGRAQEIRPIAENLLRDFLAQYYTYVADQNNPDSPEPRVRVNVMLLNVRFRGFWPKHLTIFYRACPNGISYSDEEIALKWKARNGLSGWVWKNKREAHYDRDTPNLAAAAERRSETQESVVGNLKSVYSVPIWSQGKIVGILNLDSVEGINDTYFNHRFVLDLAGNFARDLAPILPNDGVKI